MCTWHFEEHNTKDKEENSKQCAEQKMRQRAFARDVYSDQCCFVIAGNHFQRCTNRYRIVCGEDDGEALETARGGPCCGFNFCFDHAHDGHVCSNQLELNGSIPAAAAAPALAVAPAPAAATRCRFINHVSPHAPCNADAIGTCETRQSSSSSEQGMAPCGFGFCAEHMSCHSCYAEESRKPMEAAPAAPAALSDPRRVNQCCWIAEDRAQCQANVHGTCDKPQWISSSEETEKPCGFRYCKDHMDKHSCVTAESRNKEYRIACAGGEDIVIWSADVKVRPPGYLFTFDFF